MYIHVQCTVCVLQCVCVCVRVDAMYICIHCSVYTRTVHCMWIHTHTHVCMYIQWIYVYTVLYIYVQCTVCVYTVRVRLCVCTQCMYVYTVLYIHVRCIVCEYARKIYRRAVYTLCAVYTYIHSTLLCTSMVHIVYIYWYILCISMQTSCVYLRGHIVYRNAKTQYKLHLPNCTHLHFLGALECTRKAIYLANIVHCVNVDM